MLEEGDPVLQQNSHDATVSYNKDPNWLLDGVYAPETGWHDLSTGNSVLASDVFTNNTYYNQDYNSKSKPSNGTYNWWDLDHWYRTKSDHPWPTSLTDITGIKTRVAEQKPYLLVGDDGTNSTQSDDIKGNPFGFNKRRIILSLWVPENQSEITLQTYDLCHGFWDGYILEPSDYGAYTAEKYLATKRQSTLRINGIRLPTDPPTPETKILNTNTAIGNGDRDANSQTVIDSLRDRRTDQDLLKWYTYPGYAILHSGEDSHSCDTLQLQEATINLNDLRTQIAPFETKDLIDPNNPQNLIKYQRYGLYIYIQAKGIDANLFTYIYYNQFRVRVKPPVGNEKIYLVFSDLIKESDTAKQRIREQKLNPTADSHGISVANWIPKAETLNQNNQLTWQQTHIVAPECSVSRPPGKTYFKKAHIGLYDSDIHNDYEPWLKDGNGKILPKVDIKSMNLTDYLGNLDPNTGFVRDNTLWNQDTPRTLTFNGYSNDTHLPQDVNYPLDANSEIILEDFTAEGYYSPGDARAIVSGEDTDGDGVPDIIREHPTERAKRSTSITVNNETLFEASDNDWENLPYYFDVSKAYKIRFYNLAAANYVQLRVPFDFTNATCPVPNINKTFHLKIRLTEDCKLYVRFLNILSDTEINATPNALIEIKLRNKVSNSYLTNNKVAFTSIDSAQNPVDPRAYKIWHQHASQNDRDNLIERNADPNNTITELLSFSELLYSDWLNDIENLEVVVPGNYRDSANNLRWISGWDPNGVPVPIIADTGVTFNGKPLPTSYEDCLGHVAKIDVQSCWIRFERLNITRGSNRPDLHLEIRDNGNPLNSISYTDEITRVPNTHSKTVPQGRRQQPPVNIPDNLIDLWFADDHWFADAYNFTFEITGYYENNTFQPFVTYDNNGFAIQVRFDIDVSDYTNDLPSSTLPNACKPTGSTERQPCSVPGGAEHLFQSISETLPNNNGGNTNDTISSYKKGGNLTWSHRHYHEHDHQHDDSTHDFHHDSDTIPDPNDPNPPPHDHRHAYVEHDDNNNYYARQSATDAFAIDFNSFRAPTDAEMALWAQTLLVDSQGLSHIDTTTTLTGNNHPVRIKPQFDESAPNLMTTNLSNQVTISSQQNPTGSIYWQDDNVTYTFTVTAFKIQPTEALSTSYQQSSRQNNGSVLQLTDTRQIYSSAVTSYLWTIEWELEIIETVEYIYRYRDYTHNSSVDGNSNSGTGTHRSSSYGSYNSPYEDFTNTVIFTGEWLTCSRTLIVQPPNCGITSLDPSDYRRESADTNDNGLLDREVYVFPVGDTNNRYSLFRLTNYNDFKLKTTSSVHPEFNIRGDPSVSRPYSNNFNQDFSTDTKVKSLAIGGSYNYTEEPIYIGLPGKYRLTWTANWLSDAQSSGGETWNGNEAWIGIEHEDSVCNGDRYIDIYIWADPPKCRIERTAFEVGNTQTSIAIVLENANLAPINVSFAQYTINRTASSPPDNRTGRDDPHTIPAATATNNGILEIKSTQQPISLNGQYYFHWSIIANMGNERWTTHPPNDNPSDPSVDTQLANAQNSWFEDADERITPTGTDGNEPCEEVLRIAVKPYFKVFYGDVGAGGYFGLNKQYDACAGENVIRTWYNNNPADENIRGFIAAHAEGSNGGDVRGSSVKHGIQAYNLIKGLYSASQRQIDHQPLKGLTLGNTDATLDYGGNFAQPNCIANYWREVDELTAVANDAPGIPDINIDLDTLNNNDRKHYVLKQAQKLIINSSGSLDSLKATLFIEGEGSVYIRGDIINNRITTHWNHPSEIGYIMLIVRGNIYIEPTVERIDAVLVAYPELSSAGIGSLGQAKYGQIWTCYFEGINEDNHFNNCNTKLTINGAVIAQKVILGRIYKSIKEVASGVAEDIDISQASEEINLLPEYLLGTPELPIFPDQLYKSESVSSLPVNL